MYFRSLSFNPDGKMGLTRISDKWTSVRRTKQSLKQSSTRCHDTPSAGLVLEVNLFWREVKYCGRDDNTLLVTSLSGTLIGCSKVTKSMLCTFEHTAERTPGHQVSDHSAPETSHQWSGRHRATVSSGHSSLCSYLVVHCIFKKCGILNCPWLKLDFVVRHKVYQTCLSLNTAGHRIYSTQTLNHKSSWVHLRLIVDSIYWMMLHPRFAALLVKTKKKNLFFFLACCVLHLKSQYHRRTC